MFSLPPGWQSILVEPGSGTPAKPKAILRNFAVEVKREGIMHVKKG